MKRFDKKERQNTEDTIIALIRDFNHHGMMDLVLNHGIDSPRYFSDPINRKIFDIYLRMHQENVPVFLNAFQNYLIERYETGDLQYKKQILEKFLLTFPNRGSNLSQENAEFFIWKFKQHLIEDYWNHIFRMNENDSWRSKDIIETSFYIVDGFNNLWEKFAKRYERSNNDSIKERLKQKVKNQREGISTSIKVDLTQFDDFTGGFEDGELYYVAARPSMGKTSFMIALAKRMMFRGKKVHLFTLEMTKEQFINKFVSAEMGIPYKRLKAGKLTDDELQRALQLYDFYENHPYLVIEDLDQKNLLTDFYQKCKEVDAHIRMVDYAQLLKNDEGVRAKLGNREQEVSVVSQTLKRIAKEVGNPVIALAQLSRAIDNRPNKRPILSDLRESGSMEQDADVVIFLYRNAYYTKAEGKFVTNEENGNLEVIIAKGREIGTGTIMMHIDLENIVLEEGFKY